MARVSAAILCDFAQVRENLLFVSSGGVSRIAIEWPMPHSAAANPPVVLLHLGVLVEIGPDEREQAHEVRVALSNPDTAETHLVASGGLQIGPVHSEQPGTVPLEPGEPAIRPLTFPLAIPANRLGQWDVRVTADNDSAMVSLWTVARPS